MWQMRQLIFEWAVTIIIRMNDLRLLLQADKDRKIINLEFKQISNMQIMMPVLSKFQNLESLSLNGNRLQSLPPDLSALDKLNELDISNNLFRDAEDILPALKSLPRLSHLMYSFKNDDEENLLKKELPRLERLNKRPLNSIALITKKKERTTVLRINEKDLEQMAVVYDDIREVYKKNKYFVDKELAEEFDRGVDNIMAELSTRLTSAVGEEEVNSSIVGCRYALIDLCFVKLITYFYHFDKNIASILQRIHDNMAESFKNMSDILKSALDRTKAEIAQVTVKKEQIFKNEIRRLKQIQESHLSQISDLESKNAELLDRLTKNSKTNVLETTINNIIKRRGRSPGKAGLSRVKQTAGMDPGELSLRFNKALSLNQLKQVMNEIYVSKAKHNMLCLDSGIPMETMEAHMYTFLNQKYGLKAMTVEWAMSIVNGIKKYGQDDAEVATFGKILRNQLDEEYVETIKKSKANIRAAIRKFKGDDPNLVSQHEGEQILLISGYKRDAIDLVMSRLKQEQLVDGQLPPSVLQQLALDYLLRKHCQKLKGACLTFKQVDTDQDGVINHEQLYIFVQKLNIKSEIDADELTQILDPFSTNVITFSQLIEKIQKMATFKEAFL